MAPSSTTEWNNKYILVNNSGILVNNSGGKHILLKKFDQLMYITNRKFLSKISTKSVAWKLVSDYLFVKN